MIWALIRSHGGTIAYGHSFMSSLLDLIEAYSSGDEARLQDRRRQILRRERSDIGGRQ